MIIEEKNKQIKSIVHTKDYFTFIGFCFENNASKPKKVDVYCNNKKITSILSNISNPQLEAIYDIEQSNVCFEYDLPSEYIKEDNIIRFKCHDTQEELKNSPIDFSQIKNFNEIAFMHSLNQPINDEMKNMYYPNAIGFLATKENLEDEEFVGYIKELMVRFPEVEFKGFCFDNRVHLFDSSIKPIKVNDIRQLAQHVTILLTNPNTIMERTLIQSYFKNTFAILTYNKININMKIKNIINENLIALYKNNLDIFRLTSKDIQKYPNHILLASLVLSKSLNNEFKNILLNQEHTLKEHAIKIITLLLQDKDFIYPLNKLRKTIRSLLLKG
jgi:hypothetical protein